MYDDDDDLNSFYTIIIHKYKKKDKQVTLIDYMHTRNETFNEMKTEPEKINYPR